MEYEYYSMTGDKLDQSEISSLIKYNKRIYEFGKLLREELWEKDNIRRIIYHLDISASGEIIKAHLSKHRNVPFFIHYPLENYMEGIHMKKVIEFNENGQEIEYFNIYFGEYGNEVAVCYFLPSGTHLFSIKFIYNLTNELIYELEYNATGEFDSGYDYINDKTIRSLDNINLNDKEKLTTFSIN